MCTKKKERTCIFITADKCAEKFNKIKCYTLRRKC